MTEGLQPAVGIDRQVAIEVERAGEDFLPPEPALGKAEVLHQHQLGGREAVVYLCHGELAARVGNAGLLVRVGG